MFASVVPLLDADQVPPPSSFVALTCTSYVVPARNPLIFVKRREEERLLPPEVQFPLDSAWYCMEYPVIDGRPWLAGGLHLTCRFLLLSGATGSTVGAGGASGASSWSVMFIVTVFESVPPFSSSAFTLTA